MRKLIQHVVVFAAINGLLIAIWYLVGGGTTETLRLVMAHPDKAIKLKFWPIWPILGWGAFLVMHAGFVVSNMFTPQRKRRRRSHKLVNDAKRAGEDIAKDVVAAIDRAHERRMNRDAKQQQRRETEQPTSPSAPARRWVTVMFCDIADSTSHNERLGDDEWHGVLGHIRSVVRSALAERGGSEVGTQGDGMLSRFQSPADAVLCAIDIQSELGQARATSDFVPEVRIGVHAGDAVEEEGDLIGRVINLASRVTDEAVPGEILVTEPVADQLIGKLELEDKGLRPLKGLAQPRHLLAVRWSTSTD